MKPTICGAVFTYASQFEQHLRTPLASGGHRMSDKASDVVLTMRLLWQQEDPENRILPMENGFGEVPDLTPFLIKNMTSVVQNLGLAYRLSEVNEHDFRDSFVDIFWMVNQSIIKIL